MSATQTAVYIVGIVVLGLVVTGITNRVAEVRKTKHKAENCVCKRDALEEDKSEDAG